MTPTRKRHAHPRAYYVSVRAQGGRGAAILALGPFADHGRALGLVESVRMLIGFRAELDPWAEFGYGTCSTPAHLAQEGALNAFLNIGPDPRFPSIRPAQRLGDAIRTRLAEVTS